eukprot:CAMPEP_0114476450 /NCGR_PEP_ID=MMETSP0104-20121206/14760_1 /TAXON_ID=37642 ORGANISM="Paraphysomonas imperforata, Strain PA2" /NCGR_SAMPLE_ID=MMETSP0104 /ASSEMBLY_ACC=CAM_ASM_000202 /LENGTH=766 /DNA_ID=CAMNT_0001651179 /DNA_START=79 /DNA_END=2379 /DNA_ORIENTATION=+
MSDVYEVEVPKTIGEDGKASLRIDIRTDADVLGPGLFIYGFLPDSSAERQGLLQIGDELLMVNDVDVEAGSLEDLLVAMQKEEYANSDSVPMMIRRQTDQARHVSSVSTPFAMLPPVQENVLSPHSHQSRLSNPEDDSSPVVNTAEGSSDSPGGFVLEIDVPKTDNRQQRSDPQMFDKGLFIFGFLTENSRAEQQGNLQIGDEVLEVNGINVAGGTADDVDAILCNDVFPDVLLKIYRAKRTSDSAVSSVKAEYKKSEDVHIPLHTMPSLNLSPFDHDADSGSTPSRRIEAPPLQPLSQQRPAPDTTGDHESNSFRGPVTMPSLGNLQPLNYDSDTTDTSRRSTMNRMKSNDVLGDFSASSPVHISVSSVPSIPENPTSSRQSPPMRGVGQESSELLGRNDSTHSVERRNARLSSFSSNIFELAVPKTDGKLKIDIRCDEETFGPGLFVYGFARGSNVEKQGLLRVGDELLALNGYSVDGGTIEDLAEASRQTNPSAPAVTLKVRRVSNVRHAADVTQGNYVSSPSFNLNVVNTPGEDVDEPTPSMNDMKKAAIPPALMWTQVLSKNRHSSGSHEDSGIEQEHGRLAKNVSSHEPAPDTPVLSLTEYMNTQSDIEGGQSKRPPAQLLRATSSLQTLSDHEHSPPTSYRDTLPSGDLNTRSMHSIEKRLARLSSSSCSIFEVDVPKTDGRLKVDIRSNTNMFGPGLFVCGFAPGSRAEKQDLLRMGDELLAVNGQTVDGGSMSDLIKTLRRVDTPQNPVVKLKIRRV